MKVISKKRIKKAVLLMVACFSIMGTLLVAQAASCPKGGEHTLGKETL